VERWTGRQAAVYNLTVSDVHVAYFTQDMVSPEDANGVLFAGNPRYLNRGTHVIAFRIPKGVLVPGTQANEVAHIRSFRFTLDQVIYHGPNPFRS